MEKNITDNHFSLKSDFKDLIKIMKICLLFLFAFTFHIMATDSMAQDAVNIAEPTKMNQQQGRTITGRITDTNGEPIIGATIIVKNNPSHGTVADIDGNFTLTNVPEGATLVFSYVGMKPQEVSTVGRSTISIVLDTDVESLDEVIVV